MPEFQLWDYVFREEVGEPPVDGCPVSAGRTHCPEQFLIDPPGDAEALLASAYDLYYDGHEGADARYVPEAAGRPAYLQLLGPVEIQYFEPGTWLQLSGMTSRWLGLALDRALFARDFESWSRYNSVRAAEVHNGTIYGWLADASYVVVEGSPYPFYFENSRQGQEVHGYDAFRLHDALYTLLEKSGRPEAWERGDNSYWISSTRQLQWDPEWVEFSVSEDGRVDEIYAYGELYEPTSVLAHLLESIVIGEPTEDTLEVPSALGEPVFDETGATAEFVGTHQKSGNQTRSSLRFLVWPS